MRPVDAAFADIAWAGFWPLLTVAFAPFWGSFLALFVERWPAGAPVITGRSRCDHCGRPLAVTELVPILSWLWLRGRCRQCKAAIGFGAPAFEIAMLALALLVVTAGPPGIRSFFWLIAAGLVLAVGVIDARHLVIPTGAVAVILLLGLADGLVARSSFAHLLASPLGDRALGAVAGYAGMALLRQAYRHLRGREGLGGGDPLLMAALGAWLGWRALPMALLFAAVAGLAFVLAGALVRRRWPQATDILAFGPFLIVGALCALAWEQAGGWGAG